MMCRRLQKILLMMMMPFRLFAQDDTMYLNNQGLMTDKEVADGYRLLHEIDSGVLVREYDMSHHLLTTGRYTNRNCQIRHGWFVLYTAGGKKQAEGAYRMGLKDGCWSLYAGDGTTRTEQQCFRAPGAGYYSTQYRGKEQAVWREGQIDEHGLKTGQWKEYYTDTSTLRLEQHYEAGIRMGNQFEYYRNGQLKRQERMEGYGRVKGRMFDEQGRKIPYYPAFSQARPPETLRKYLATRIPCFENLLKAGDMHYRIHIAMTGIVLDAELPGLPDHPCGTEILRALRQMRKWKPAQLENKPVDHWVEGWIKYHTPRD